MNKRTSDNMEWNGNMLINFLMVSSRTIDKISISLYSIDLS